MLKQSANLWMSCLTGGKNKAWQGVGKKLEKMPRQEKQFINNKK